MKALLSKLDIQHMLLLVGAPALMSFLDYEMANQSPLSKESLARAGLAAATAALAVLKQLLTQPVTSSVTQPSVKQ